MPATIVLVRHGETDWNRERRFQGHADTPLNEAGRSQASELAELFLGEPVTAIYTSPLRRASATAEILADKLGLEARPHEAFREIDVGTWEGLTIQEVKRKFPERTDQGSRPGWKDGETYEDLASRVVPALLELGSKHEDGQVLVVTHAGPIRAALAASMGLSHDDARPLIGPLVNCAVHRFAVRDDNLEAVD